MNIDQSLNELNTKVQHVQISVNCISDKIEENKSKCDALTTKINNLTDKFNSKINNIIEAKHTLDAEINKLI